MVNRLPNAIKINKTTLVECRTKCRAECIADDKVECRAEPSVELRVEQSRL